VRVLCVGRIKRTISDAVRAIITALAVCHNVTPVVEEDATTGDRRRAYQASSPDEVALVKFTETVGLTLSQRTFRTITLTNPEGAEEVRRGAIARGAVSRSLTNAAAACLTDAGVRGAGYLPVHVRDQANGHHRT